MPRAPHVSVNLLSRVRTDFPNLLFSPGETDHWNACGTIYYTPNTPDHALLHELAHAILDHAQYTFDIDLIRVERAAWDYARRVLGPRYGVVVAPDDAEDALDTYRAWLHNRSLCPDCHASGLQQSDLSYRCVACRAQWRANPAKTCALRRVRKHPVRSGRI